MSASLYGKPVLYDHPIFLDIMSDTHFELASNEHMLNSIRQYWKKSPSYFNLRTKDGLNIDENVDKYYRLLAACGDICSIEQLPTYLDEVSSLYDYVLFVPGNHEYYGKEMNSINVQLNIIHNDYSNVHIFSPGKERLLLRDDLAVHGSTLWADVYKGCRVNSKRTPISIGDRYLNYVDMNSLHEYAVKRLLDSMDYCLTNDIDLIVLSHHAPSLSVKNIQHQNDHCGYVSNLTDSITKPIRAWIYGHTHLNVSTTIGDTLITSSQWGSPKNIVKNSLII